MESDRRPGGGRGGRAAGHRGVHRHRPGRAGAACEGHHRQRQPDVQLSRRRSGAHRRPSAPGPWSPGWRRHRRGPERLRKPRDGIGRDKPGQRRTGGQRPFQGLRGTAAPVDLRPDLGVRVAVRDGRLTGVSVRPVAGKTVAGQDGDRERPWPGPPWPGRRWPGRTPPFAELAHALGAGAVPDLPGHRDGRGPRRPRTVMASDFRTLRPRRSFSAATILGAGETVGVGMPIMINFSQPITDRAAVERACRSGRASRSPGPGTG